MLTVLLVIWSIKTNSVVFTTEYLFTFYLSIYAINPTENKSDILISFPKQKKHYCNEPLKVYQGLLFNLNWTQMCAVKEEEIYKKNN